MFDVFLGDDTLDASGRRNVASGVLWAANGLSFKVGGQGADSVGRMTKEGRMELDAETEVLPATTAVFRLLPAEEPAAPMLVNKIALRDI